MDVTIITVIRDLVSSIWFIRLMGLVVALYVVLFLVKVMRAEEGFLFGYGKWIFGQWKLGHREKPQVAAAPEVVRTEPAPAQPTTPPRPRRNNAALEQDLAVKERVLKLSSALDIDLAYLMICKGERRQVQIQRAIKTLIHGITQAVHPAGQCRCGFFVPDDSGEYLVMMEGANFGKGKRPRLHLDRSCAGRAFQTRNNYYCVDITTDPVYWHSDVENGEFRSIACVPVEVGSDIYGVVCLDAPQPNAFTQDDFAHLEAFAAKLAVICAFHHLESGAAGLMPEEELP